MTTQEMTNTVIARVNEMKQNVEIQKTMKTIQNGITKETAYLHHIYSNDCILEYYDF